MSIQQGVAFPLYFQSNTTAGAANTATTPTVTLKPSTFAGVEGATAATTNAAVHISNGLWRVLLTAAEMANDVIGWTASGASLFPVGGTIVTEEDFTTTVAGRIDAAISSRLSTSGYTAPDNAGIDTLEARLTASRATALDNLDATISSRLATAGYTAPPTAVAVRAEMDTNSTKLANLDATISSRLATAGYTVPPTAAAIRTEMDANSTKLANLDATISSRSTYAGADTPGTTTLLARLSAARALLLDNLDATVSSRSTYAGADTAGTTTLLSRLTAGRASNLDNLDALISSRLATSGYTVPPTVAAIADQVWDEVLAGHVTAGTTGAKLDGLSGGGGGGASAADIWAYSNRSLTDKADFGLSTAAIQAIRTEMDTNSADLNSILLALADVIGYVDALETRLTLARANALDNLDASISSRLAAAGYTAPDNAGIATLTSRLTAGRATALDNLDATVSSRSTYAGGDTAGITTLLGRLTAGRASALDNLDATVSSRSTLAAAGVRAEVVGALSVDTWDELAALPPATDATLVQMVLLLYQALRLKTETAGAAFRMYKLDDATILGQQTLTDDGATLTTGKMT